MEQVRKVRRIASSKSTIEGAGVRLRRAFGSLEAPEFDPFLLLDHFGSNDPEDYLAGFPWHPHRGIETITYMIDGEVRHEDSLGNGGVIGAGDVQWMTAGSGIIHQEMPLESPNRLMGFQLWANLPARKKMTAPKYRDVGAGKIPELITEARARIKVVAGTVDDAVGPVTDVVTEPQYLDVSLPRRTTLRHTTSPEHTVFAYVFEGEARFGPGSASLAKQHNLVVFDRGTQLLVQSRELPARFLLVSGKPIGEPVAWKGPIVMNTQDELEQAFAEYRQGTFLKHH